MKKCVSVFGLAMLVGCASNSVGVVPSANGSYTVSASKAVVGFGYSEAAKESVLSQAEKFCAGRGGKTMELIDFKQTPSSFGKGATATGTFKCI